MLILPPWKTTYLERPPSSAIALYRFHCIMAWISNYIHVKQCNVITHPCPDLNHSIAKLGHGGVVTLHMTNSDLPRIKVHKYSVFVLNGLMSSWYLVQTKIYSLCIFWPHPYPQIHPLTCDQTILDEWIMNVIMLCAFSVCYESVLTSWSLAWWCWCYG